MPKHLSDLLNANLIHVGDTIYFIFKKKMFTGIVTEHGFIHRTKFKGEDIFGSKCFDTPTQWAETCLQEHLHEYNTRYSAWRRVKHRPTEKSLESIYKSLQKDKLLQQRHLHGTRLQQLVRLQQMESCELKTQLETAHEALDQWHDWWRNHSGNTPPPVPEICIPQVSETPPPTKMEDVERVESPDVAQTSIWYPPSSASLEELQRLEPQAVAAYVHAFFT
jgi:hypothetical protein